MIAVLQAQSEVPTCAPILHRINWIKPFDWVRRVKQNASIAFVVFTISTFNLELIVEFFAVNQKRDSSHKIANENRELQPSSRVSN